MSIEGPQSTPESREGESPIVISKVRPEDYRGAIEVLYKAQLANYPNEELGITREDIEANFAGEFTDEKVREGEGRWRTLPENPNELYLVAKKDQKILGRFIAIRGEDRNQLHDIYIDPEAQGQGLGKRFWTEALEFFDPAKDTVVMVLPYNEQAKSYYRSLGFVETGRNPHEDEGTEMASGAVMPAPIEMVRKADVSES